MSTIGSLFSGIGGLEWGLELAGVGETVWQVESNPYCRTVLRRHWPKARRYTDVRDVGSDNLQRVEVICGGFPCQDISFAGNGAGLDGDRSGLWYEFARIVRELRPRFVVVENVSALLRRGVDAVLGTLASLGYDAEWSCIRASDVGAPHRRDRLFIIAWLAEPAGVRRELGDALAGGGGAPALSGRLDVEAYELGESPGRGAEAASDADGERWAHEGLVDARQERSGRSVAVGVVPLADAGCVGLQRWAVDRGVRGEEGEGNGERLQRQWGGHAARDGGAAVADGDGGRRERIAEHGHEQRSLWSEPDGRGAWRRRDRALVECHGPRSAQPSLRRGADGISTRLDAHRWPVRPGETPGADEAGRTVRSYRGDGRHVRLAALGNAVVPQVVSEVVGPRLVAIRSSLAVTP